MRKLIICKKCLKHHYDDQPCDRTKRPKSNWEELYPGAQRGPRPTKKELIEKAPPKMCAICRKLENQGGRLVSLFFMEPVFGREEGQRIERGPQDVHKTCYRKLMSPKR
jgi:hypothetical protein